MTNKSDRFINARADTLLPGILILWLALTGIASVFVMVVDPEHHGGRAAFERQTGFMAGAARGAKVPDGASAVRLPGERALRLRRQQMAEGVALSDELLARLRKALPDRPLDASR